MSRASPDGHATIDADGSMSTLTLDEALKVIRTLASGDPRQFHVGIVGYFLDGIPL